MRSFDGAQWMIYDFSLVPRPMGKTSDWKTAEFSSQVLGGTVRSFHRTQAPAIVRELKGEDAKRAGGDGMLHG